MFRRWLRGCLLPSALCLGAAGCTTSVEQLTGGLFTTWAPEAKDERPATRADDDLPANDQLRLHLDTARQLDKGGNDEGALAEYERVLALDPANFTAMRRLSNLYDRRGGKEDFKKAEELYRKVARARPKDPDVWSDWGYSLYLRTDKETCNQNWTEAEKKLREALRLDPQHALAHDNLGLVLGQMDRYDEAYSEFRAAHLSEAEAHCDLAFLYWKKGKLDEARQQCRIARDKDPSNTKVRDMLAAMEPPAHPRERGTPAARGDGHTPRASALTEADWAAEREAARRAVAGMTGAAPAPAPVPVSAPSADKAPPWQASGPIVMPSGSRWMPVHSGAAPAVTPPTPAPTPAPPPAPSTGGTPGTITLD
jgi:tetratricopeptide (TPR) repeat protein